MTLTNSASLLIHAFIGWALCAATMGFGMATTSLQTALVIHAIGAPIAFVAFVFVVDFLLVAMAINGSLEMFTSLLGTWIPFGLIFIATYVTGLATVRRNRIHHSRGKD